MARADSGQDNGGSQDSGRARETFLTVMRYPNGSGGSRGVEGAVVLQRSETTNIELADGTTLTWDSIELRKAIEPVRATA